MDSGIHHLNNWTRGPGARFSKVPKTFRSRKAIRKSATCLLCKAGLFICCKGNKNKNNCKVSCLETPSFWRYKEDYGPPKNVRKVSGLSRNRPLVCFSKVPRTFHFRKASCQTAIYLLWKADLLTCFQCEKNQEDCEVWWLRTSASWRYKENCGTRTRPEKFRDFWDTGPGRF